MNYPDIADATYYRFTHKDLVYISKVQYISLIPNQMFCVWHIISYSLTGKVWFWFSLIDLIIRDMVYFIPKITYVSFSIQYKTQSINYSSIIIQNSFKLKMFVLFLFHCNVLLLVYFLLFVFIKSRKDDVIHNNNY